MVCNTIAHDTKKKAAPITPLIAIARLLLPASALLAVACGSAQAAAGDTLAQVKTRGTLRYGVPITLCQLAVSALYVFVMFRVMT